MNSQKNQKISLTNYFHEFEKIDSDVINPILDQEKIQLNDKKKSDVFEATLNNTLNFEVSHPKEYKPLKNAILDFEEEDVKKNFNSQKEINLNEIFLYSLYTIISILSTANIFLNILILLKLVNIIQLGFILANVAILIIIAFGFWSTYKYGKILKNFKFEYDLQDKSDERKYLNLFSYKIFIFFLFFLVLIVLHYFNKLNFENYLNVLGQDEMEWRKVFSEMDFFEAKKYIDSTSISILLITLAIITCFGILIIFFYLKIGDYSFLKNTNKFVCIVVFLLSGSLLYLTLFTTRYENIINEEKKLQVWILYGLIISSIFGLLVSFYGILSTISNSKKMINSYSLI